MTPQIAAALWVGLNILFLAYISFNVGQTRIKHKINLGDGDNPAMIAAIRAQGNYVEYAPAALLGTWVAANIGYGVMAIHAIGFLFLLARVLHFIGLGLGLWPQGRFAGIALTMLTLIAIAIMLIAKAFM